MTRTVALYGHRVEPVSPTGEGLYVRRLIAAIAAADPPDISYRVGASREPAGPDGTPGGLPVLRPRWPRKALHASWTAFRRPRVDRALQYPDLIHVLYPACPVPSRAPIVYTIHDLMPLTAPEWYPRQERVLFARCMADAADRATVLIADSERTAAEVRDRLGVKPDRIQVVHLAVDDVFFSRPERRDVDQVVRRYDLAPERYFVVLGTVSSRKNILTLIEAIARLEPAGRPVLVAVGPPGIGAEEAAARASALGVGGSVRFTGWLPTADVLALLGGSAGLLHPSMDEGFGMTPLEAMASGVPTASSDAGSLPEVTGDASILIDPLDAEAWAEAARRLLEDTDFRAELIARGNAHAARYTWARVADETMAVHRSVLGA